MDLRSQFTAVLPINPNKDNKIHSIALTAALPTGDVASHQSAGEDDFRVFKNDHISLK